MNIVAGQNTYNVVMRGSSSNATKVPQEPSGWAYWVIYSDGSAGWFDRDLIQEMDNEGQADWASTLGPFMSGSQVTI